MTGRIIMDTHTQKKMVMLYVENKVLKKNLKTAAEDKLPEAVARTSSNRSSGRNGGRASKVISATTLPDTHRSLTQHATHVYQGSPHIASSSWTPVRKRSSTVLNNTLTNSSTIPAVDPHHRTAHTSTRRSSRRLSPCRSRVPTSVGEHVWSGGRTRARVSQPSRSEHD